MTLLCDASLLNLEIVCRGGQAFTWIQTNVHQYAKVFPAGIVTLDERQGKIYVSPASALEQVKTYFNMHHDLAGLYSSWSEKDVNFARKQIPGIRLLNQDLVENIFSFICSSNNNISRITGMIQNMSREFGESAGNVYNHLTQSSQEMFSFPSVKALSESGVEAKLRELGFGYRAKYVQKSAQFLSGQNKDFLDKLREKSIEEAREDLLQLSGVGPKVADCILLMSCGKMQVIPVDTHVYQIAVRDYGFSSKSKNMSKDIYDRIQVLFYNLFGNLAGWAHTVLFVADLAQFKEKKYKRRRVS